MAGTSHKKFIETVNERVVNATLLAEVIHKAAYADKIEISAIGASCEVLHEYLDNTWDMVSES